MYNNISLLKKEQMQDGYGNDVKSNYLTYGLEYPIWTCRNKKRKINILSKLFIFLYK